MVALGVALGVFGLLLPDSGFVAAQATPSASRSLSSTSINAGDQVTVTITVDYAGLSAVDRLAVGVRETPPSGFTYVSSSLGAGLVSQLSGGVVGFAPLGETSFTYVVAASSATAGGDYHFSGVLVTDPADPAQSHPIGGDNTIAVTAAPEDTPTPTPEPTATSVPTGPSAMRVLPSGPVAPGASVVVAINVNYGNLGAADRLAVGIEERLPSGFAYVSSSLDDQVVSDLGNGVIGFAPLGEESFTYTVTASSAGGNYSFTGTMKGVPGMPAIAIGGDSSLAVEDPEAPSATRSFSNMYVEEGGELVVTIDIDYSNLGAADKLAVGVEETLPSGFTYVSSSLGDMLTTTVSAGVIGFAPLGGDSFTYTVTAPSVRDTYSFSGILRGLTPAPMIGGDTDVTVGPVPTPTPTPVPPTATPRPDETPTVPTRTPRPTAVPPAPPTPVAIEKADVTAVEGAMTVQPDESAIVASADGAATVMLPNTSRARTYQVMVVTDAENCSGVGGALQACALVMTYDAEGNPETDVELIRRATVVLMLSSSMVDDLGGLPVVFQANALGGFSVYQQNADGAWSMRRFSMGLNDDGGVMATVTGLRTLGAVALTVDEDILQTAMYQVAGITPTAVPTPEPTAVPTPEPTAVPPEQKPEVGDATAPVGLLIVLALTGALMVYTGSRVMRGRRSAVR